jgi:predicted dehydrogenase
VIGSGFGTKVVAPVFATVPGCEVVEAVTPRDDAAVAKLCARADIDLVSVHSPPFLHLAHVRAAIDAGHAVLCDKPFGLDANQAAEMASLAALSGVGNFLNFERRYDPARLLLHHMLRDGVIGTPDHFQYSRFTAMPAREYGWLSRRDQGGGWLGGQGSHLIDACRWLFGDIADGAAVMRILAPHRTDRSGAVQSCDAEDGFTAVLRMKSNVTAVIDCALESSVSVPEKMTVFGSAGMLEINDTSITHHKPGGETEIHPVDMAGRTPLVAAMGNWAHIVCDAVRSGVTPEEAPTFEDGLACSVAMDHLGRNVPLDAPGSLG